MSGNEDETEVWSAPETTTLKNTGEKASPTHTLKNIKSNHAPICKHLIGHTAFDVRHQPSMYGRSYIEGRCRTSKPVVSTSPQALYGQQ